MPRRARPETITLRDFVWSKDPQGYRLSQDGAVQPFSDSQAGAVGYRPFKTGENLLGDFVSIQDPHGVLAFIRKFGPLTEEGKDSSKGEQVNRVLAEVQSMVTVLRAEKSKDYPIFLPSDPKTISLVLKKGGRASGGAVLKCEPRSLLDAIWIQVAQALAGEGKIRHCPHCGNWFVAGGQSSRREDAKFCTDEHRIAYNNDKRAGGRD